MREEGVESESNMNSHLSENWRWKTNMTRIKTDPIVGSKLIQAWIWHERQSVFQRKPNANISQKRKRIRILAQIEEGEFYANYKNDLC